MLRIIVRSLLFAGVPLMLLAGIPSGASASPAASPMSSRQTLTCDNGSVYHTAAVGHGLFSPAHDLNSTAILAPIEYGDITFTFTGSDGSVSVDVAPGSSLGQGA